MDEASRLNLQDMIKAYDADDNTAKIRNLKHSKLIKNDVEQLINLKKKYTRMAQNDYKKYERIVISHCNFLFTNYTNIFNRLMKNELNLNILMQFVNILKNIEDGNLGQHEASVQVGEVLKKLYIDSALQHEKKIAAGDKKRAPKYKKPSNNISWAKFKAAGFATVD